MIEIINTSKDDYKEGLAKAMKPFVLRWKRNKYWYLGKVNLSSALLDNKTVLGYAKVPRSVKKVEYVIVMGDGITGRLGYHGQLRFVFDKEIVTDTGNYKDLIISFEGWRHAGHELNVEKSLKDNFLITSRCYVGPQRFLKDTLRGRYWKLFELDLKDKNDFFDHVIRSCQELTTVTMSKYNLTSKLFLEYNSFFHNQPIKRKVFFNLVNNNCAINILMVLSNYLGGKQAEEIKKGIKKIPEFMTKEKVIRKRNYHNILLWLIKNNKVVPGRTYKYLKNAKLIDTRLKKSKYRIFNVKNNPYGKIKEVTM